MHRTRSFNLSQVLHELQSPQMTRWYVIIRNEGVFDHKSFGDLKTQHDPARTRAVLSDRMDVHGATADRLSSVITRIVAVKLTDRLALICCSYNLSITSYKTFAFNYGADRMQSVLNFQPRLNCIFFFSFPHFRK